MENCTQELGLRMSCDCLFISFLEGNPPEQHPWQQRQLAAVPQPPALGRLRLPGQRVLRSEARGFMAKPQQFFPCFLPPLSLLMPQELNTP